jgi:hypothetical protein
VVNSYGLPLGRPAKRCRPELVLYGQGADRRIFTDGCHVGGPCGWRAYLPVVRAQEPVDSGPRRGPGRFAHVVREQSIRLPHPGWAMIRESWHPSNLQT